jgi:hypothetical protein
VHLGARLIRPHIGADAGDVAAERAECVLQQSP